MAALDNLGAARAETDLILQELVHEVREAFGTDLCMVNLILSDVQYFRAWSGELPADLAEARQDPRERSMCRYVVENEAPLVVKDFLATEEFRGQYFRVEYGIRFYAGAPLLTSGGHAIGSLCLLHTEPREFGEGDLVLLQAFARAVVGRLELLGALERERAAWEEEARRGRELKRIVEQKERILGSAGEGIVGLDTGGKIEFANPAAAAMLGYEPGAMVGENMHDLVHHTRPDGTPYPREECPNYAALREGEVLRSDEEVYWRKDGTSFPVEYVSNPVIEGGELQGAVVTFDDVSERKRAEEALKESEERFRTLTDAALEALMISEQGKILEVNRAYTEIFGYEPSEVVGEFAGLGVAPESRDLVQKNILSGYDKPYEAVGLRKNGERFEAEIRGKASAYRGRAVRITAVRDITERKRAEEALRQSEADLASAQRIAHLGSWRWDSLTGELLWSDETYRIFGLAPREPVPVPFELFYNAVHPDDREPLGRTIRAALREGEGYEIVYRLIRPDGEVRFVSEQAEVIPDAAGRLVRMFGTAHDITERKKVEEALRKSEKRFRSLVQNASDLITVLGTDGTVLYESPAIERILGYETDELVGENVFDLVHPDDAPRVQRTFAALSDGTKANPYVEYRFRHQDGSWRHIESSGVNLLDEPSVGGIVVNSRDVTERKLLEERLLHQALHDPLTGLPNRALLLNRLKHALERAGRHEGCVAVLFLDLDDFKVVNDSLGHEAGDRLLVAASERLRAYLRPEDTLARLGGDEFVVLLEDVRSRGEATGVAERIAGVLQNSFPLGTHEEVFVSASIGVALGGPDENLNGDLPDDLLRRADMAMYQAKRKGKARHEVFEPCMDAPALGRLRMGTDLRRAVERGEFRVHYQPEVSLRTGEVVGFEALVRWEHPEHGLVSPAHFIPVAEEMGLIVPMGRWVLEEACRQARAWHDRRPNGPPLVMSVNLSARQFGHPDLVRNVSRTLRETGVKPSCLILELTESVVMDDARSTVGTLGELKALGVGLAIDDFGTGYSSLSYLKRFSVDYLKVDRSFVDGLGEDPEDAVLVSGIVNLAHALGLKVVGEGVETEGQLGFLRDLGCDLAQGYHFSRPLPAQKASELLFGEGLCP